MLIFNDSTSVSFTDDELSFLRLAVSDKFEEYEEHLDRYELLANEATDLSADSDYKLRAKYWSSRLELCKYVLNRLWDLNSIDIDSDE